ncbi:MAG TPA: FecR domain-containing protein [Mariniphaga sp.]|nr:FecR domain-containing protein [Mariniphaga sp.]
MMDLNKYKDYSTEDFIEDDAFLNWVLHPDQSNVEFWKSFLMRYPEKKLQIDQAYKIIKAFDVTEPYVSPDQLNSLYRKIEQDKQQRRRFIRFIKAAAIFLILISVGGILLFDITDKQEFPSLAVNPEQLETGKIILPDGSINEFETKQTEIKQSPSGSLTINDDTITIDPTPEKDTKNTMAQLIIPYGKRSEITLSDGTKIWLNSGSQLSYPINFTGNSKDVYLSGEAFFDVVSDPEKPFNVHTSDLVIKVKGTRFNITSYSGDNTSQAVLVTGRIEAAKNKRFARTIMLNPGERASYDRDDGKLEKDQVDVELYSSWVEGYLIFENEPVDIIFKKLERYYNKSIRSNQLSMMPTFTGKLNLAEDLDNVLQNIGFSANFRIEHNEDIYIVKQL